MTSDRFTVPADADAAFGFVVFFGAAFALVVFALFVFLVFFGAALLAAGFFRLAALGLVDSQLPSLATDFRELAFLAAAEVVVC